MVYNLLYSPRKGYSYNHIEHQSVVNILFPGYGDEEFSNNRVGYKHGSRNSSEPHEDLQHPLGHDFYQSHTTHNDEDGYPEPRLIIVAHYKSQGRRKEEDENPEKSMATASLEFTPSKLPLSSE